MKVLTPLLAVAANAWTVDKMHRPQGRVADPDGLLKNPDAIEDALARLATKHVDWPPNSPCATTTVDGVEAVVVVVTHLRGVHLKQEDDEKVAEDRDDLAEDGGQAEGGQTRGAEQGDGAAAEGGAHHEARTEQGQEGRRPRGWSAPGRTRSCWTRPWTRERTSR